VRQVYPSLRRRARGMLLLRQRCAGRLARKTVALTIHIRGSLLQRCLGYYRGVSPSGVTILKQCVA